MKPGSPRDYCTWRPSQRNIPKTPKDRKDVIDGNPTPLEQLQMLAAQSLGAAALESSVVADRSWRGYSLRVGDWNLVFPFSEGFEVLAEQEIQPVPWAAHWVRGMTNIRGEIHTVVDFSDFLGFGAVPSLRTAILFRLPDENLKSVLLLERWVNLRTFPEGLEQTEDAGIPSPLSSLVSSVLVERKQTWVVLDVDRLCRMPEFISIARQAAGN